MIGVTEITKDMLAYWQTVDPDAKVVIFTAPSDPANCVPCPGIVTTVVEAIADDEDAAREFDVVRVAWRPNPDELTQLVAGATIWLSTWGGLPAHMLEVQAAAEPPSHERRLLQAHLDAAWLSRCGRDGSPGNWIIPGGFLPVMEGGELEVDVYPIYASLDPDGRPRGWSAHMTPGPGIVDAWDWRINAGWDDLTKEQVATLEDLGGCLDDRHTSFMTLGSHQEPPPITDEVVQALAIVDHG